MLDIAKIRERYELVKPADGETLPVSCNVDLLVLVELPALLEAFESLPRSCQTLLEMESRARDLRRKIEAVETE